MDSLSGLLQSAYQPSKQLNDLLSSASFKPPMSGFTGKGSTGQTSTGAPAGFSFMGEKQITQSSALLLETVLGKIPGSSPTVQQTSASDFGPQAVADRIIGFVDTSIQRRAGSEIEIQSMLAQAKEGIEQGLSEARDILDSIGALSGEVEQQVNETESLIFQGLDKLERALTQPEEFDGGHAQRPVSRLSAHQLSAQATDRTGISESGLISSQFKQTSEAAIEIVTRDGDRVAVSYSAFIQSGSSQRFSLDDSTFSFSSRQQSNSAVVFQFSVEGSLDAEERDSINDLLKDMGDIAGQFFQGDVQAAFNASLELGFNSEELKSFSLDFQQTTRVQVVQAYQRTEQSSNPVSSVQLPVSVNPRPAVDVLSQLENLVEQIKADKIIEEPESTLKSLLVDMLDLLNESFDSPVQAYIKDIINHPRE